MRRIKTFKETGRLCAVNNFKGKYTDPKKYGQRYCQFLFNGHDFCPYGCPEADETRAPRNSECGEDGVNFGRFPK